MTETTSDFGRETVVNDADFDGEHLQLWIDFDEPEPMMTWFYAASEAGGIIESYKNHLNAIGSTVDQAIQLASEHWAIKSDTPLTWAYARVRDF